MNTELRNSNEPVASSDTGNVIAEARGDSLVFVFRHHHTLMPDLKLRNHDYEMVIGLLKKMNINYVSHGSNGREGDQIEIASVDMLKWKQGVNELIEGGNLKYYTNFGLDEFGLGFVDLAERGE